MNCFASDFYAAADLAGLGAGLVQEDPQRDPAVALEPEGC